MTKTTIDAHSAKPPRPIGLGSNSRAIIGAGRVALIATAQKTPKQWQRL